MADSKDTVGFEVEVGGVEQSIESIKDLKNAIKAAKDEQVKAAQVYGDSSKEYINASKRVADLKDKVEDLGDSTKSLKGSGIERASEGFNQLGEGLRNLDFGKVKVGLNGLKTALASTGVMLIVMAVSYLIENFDSLSKGSGFLAKALRFVGDIIGKIIEVGKEMLNFVTDFIGLTTESERALEKQGEAIVEASKKTKEALAEQVKGFDNQIAAAKAAGKNTVDLEIAKQEAIVETNKKIAEQIIAFAKSGGTLTDEQKKLFNETINNIKDDKQAENIINITADKDKQDKYKAHQEELKKINDKAHEDEIKANDDSFNAYVKRLSDEEAALIKQQADKLAALQKSRDDIYNAEQADKAIRDQNALDEANLKVSKDQSDFDAQMALLELQRQQKLDDLTLTNTQRELINQEFSNKEDALREQTIAKEKAARQQIFSDTLNTAQSLTNSLQGLSDAYFAVKSANGKKGSAEDLANAKKQFDINKGLSIAGAVISGIQGVVNALSAQSVVPEPFGTVLKVITAAGVAGAAVANVAKISSTQFNANGAAPSGGGAAAMPPIPSPPSIDTKDNNTNADTKFDANGRNLDMKQPTINVNATVGVDEISTKTNRVNTLENQSTF
jgi:chromosome segregation ATPase